MSEIEWLNECIRLAAEPSKWTIFQTGDGTYEFSEDV